MNRCSSGMFLAIGTLAMLAGTAVAVDTPEVEPNDSKATATVANNGVSVSTAATRSRA